MGATVPQAATVSAAGGAAGGVGRGGSGVSACHNILAMEVAGMSGMRLYPGSWSEWCADASRPIASGEPAALEIPKPPRT